LIRSRRYLLLLRPDKVGDPIGEVRIDEGGGETDNHGTARFILFLDIGAAAEGGQEFIDQSDAA